MWMEESLAAFEIQSLGLPKKTDNGEGGPYSDSWPSWSRFEPGNSQIRVISTTVIWK